MKHLVLFLLGSFASACFVPVDVSRPDSGVTCTGEVPETLDTSPGQVIDFLWCDAGTVTVYGPDGGVVAVESFTPTEPGVYVAEVTSEGAVKQTLIHVDGPLTGGFIRTYVDRVDRCQIFHLTERERLLCWYDGEFVVYDPDGSLTASRVPVSGHGLSAVLGNEMWTITPEGVAHYTDTASGLQHDATWPHDGTAEDTIVFGDVRPGVALFTGNSGVFELVWDGEQLATGQMFPRTSYVGLALLDGDELRDGSLCMLKPGCQEQMCPSVSVCTEESRYLAGWEGASQLWLAAFQLQLVKRSPLSPLEPLTPARAVPHPPAPFSMYSIKTPQQPGAPAVLSTMSGAHVLDLIPMPQNGSFYFGQVDFLRTVNPRYVVLPDGPFTLRFIPR